MRTRFPSIAASGSDQHGMHALAMPVFVAIAALAACGGESSSSSTGSAIPASTASATYVAPTHEGDPCNPSQGCGCGAGLVCAWSYENLKGSFCTQRQPLGAACNEEFSWDSELPCASGLSCVFDDPTDVHGQHCRAMPAQSDGPQCRTDAECPADEACLPTSICGKPERVLQLGDPCGLDAKYCALDLACGATTPDGRAQTCQPAAQVCATGIP